MRQNKVKGINYLFFYKDCDSAYGVNANVINLLNILILFTSKINLLQNFCGKSAVLKMVTVETTPQKTKKKTFSCRIH